MLHGGLLGPFIAAPIIEESLKPSGVYLLLAKWPQALPNRYYTALLAALAGLGFALVENEIYLRVYFPEHSHEMVLIRYTASLSLHVVASFIFGLGINQKLIAAVKGEIPMFSANKRFFITAMGLHAAYNIVVVIFFRNVH